jgi:hypothetical protein
MLKENTRGRFIRITEDLADKRNSIIIPGTGLKDFQKLLDEMVSASDEIPISGGKAGFFQNGGTQGELTR